MASHVGQSSPLGATVVDGGVNFSLFSRTASGVELLLFNGESDDTPSRVLPLDPVANHTYHYWHIFAPGVKAGQLYAYRVQGPTNPRIGLRFDPSKVLLDPYGRGVVVPKNYSRAAAGREGDNATSAMKSVVVDPAAYDWEGDTPLGRPSSRTIIYEMHVRGFTRHPSSGLSEKKRGTYAGLIEKIPYLQKLGITAVELLPVFQFDAQDCPPGKVNYWGYAPISFFAPHPAYSSRQDPPGPVDEFRDLVKALHKAGIEVILDVVFNHTAEGNECGPTLSFRGIDNPTYYILENGGERYANYTGCGNTLNGNQPIVRRLIVDSLRYWVEEKHADVHRFVSLLCARRGMRDMHHERQRVSINAMLRDAKKAWHGVKLDQPDWGDGSHAVAFGGELSREGLHFHFILNAFWEPLEFELPKLKGTAWRRWIDTALDSPSDIAPWEQAPEVSGNSYRTADRSVVILFSSNG